MKHISTHAIKLCFIFLIVLCGYSSKAQYVTIPDTAFVNWLNTHGFAGCMNGNLMDTTCSAVVNASGLYCSGVPIRDLTGVQYFKSITYLDCSNDSLYFIPAFPTQVSSLICSFNNLDSLPVLPPNIQTLYCFFNQLTRLPALPGQLLYLQCQNNRLTNLPALPVSLKSLDCSSNSIFYLPALPINLEGLVCVTDSLTSLPALPASITDFECSGNKITSLPSLPSGITRLWAAQNRLTSLPTLPDSLNSLDCSWNLLTSLPTLPAHLTTLSCDVNNLDSLPSLPNSIVYITCGDDNLTALPTLPPGLQSLYCWSNNLTGLPSLPVSLRTLECESNQLTTLPTLPDSLYFIDCSYNRLTSIPTLPDSLYEFFCDDNSNLTCLPELKRIVNLDFSSTTITCLPNYGSVTSSNPALNTVPLCGVNNPNHCTSYSNINGLAYWDANGNCVFDSNDVGLAFVKVQLYQGGVLQQQTYTGGTGNYSFLVTDSGTYKMVVDSANLPFGFNCPAGDSIIITLSSVDSFVYNNDFSFKCLPGFDVGVTSIINNDVVPRPASIITINIVAGDMTEPYGTHCAAGISGQVKINYSGQITYRGPAPGARIPDTIANNTITWNISDFGAVNNQTDFNVVFGIDTFATAGSGVCMLVFVTPDGGDYNITNNVVKYCFTIVDAMDPNSKQVYPTTIDSGYQFLTYTIRFQNTGSAPAQYVNIQDTLDQHLDPTTFRFLGFSPGPNNPYVQIYNNVISFTFYGLNLPDSITSDSLSQGYVQFGIRTKAGIAISGETVSNTASVYFDENAAVVTNTVTDTVKKPAVFVNQTTSICTGDSANLGTTWYKQTGAYTDTFTATNGADSIVTLNLSVGPVVITTLSEQVCTGDSAWFGQSWYYNTGIYVDTLTAGGGCDSIITLNLTVAPVLTTTLTRKICAGDTVGVGYNRYYATGNFIDTLTAAGGCDSIVTLNLTVNPLPVITISWDTLVAHGDVTWQRYPGNPNMVAGWCAGYYLVQQFTLTGGLPAGGSYTGDGVHNNIMYPDSFGPYRSLLDTITYTYIDSNGCTNSNIDSIQINECGFSVYETSANDDAIMLYPNPTTGQLTIKTAGMMPETITVYDVNGRLIYTMPFKPDIDLTQLSSGLYFIEVASDIGVSRKRFVKM